MLQKQNSVGLLPLFSQKQAHAIEAGNVTIRATVCSRDALCDEGFRVLWRFGVVRLLFFFFNYNSPKKCGICLWEGLSLSFGVVGFFS